MILEYNGHKVDYFQKILIDNHFRSDGTPIRKLGLWLSGGTDSAFCLWYLAKCISENSLYEFEIQPIHGHDSARTMVDSRKPTMDVYNYVVDEYPDVTIHTPHIFSYYKDPEDSNKGQYHDPVRDQLKSEGKIDIVITCMTKNPPVEDIEGGLLTKRDPARDDPYETFLKERSRGDHPEHKTFFEKHRPFNLIDKKFLAHFYQVYGLGDLFKLTASCTSGYPRDEGKTIPCQECWWCLEKYWAFEMYDFGVRPYDESEHSMRGHPSVEETFVAGKKRKTTLEDYVENSDTKWYLKTK